MGRREGNWIRTKKFSDIVQCDPPRGKVFNSKSLGYEIQGLIQLHNRHLSGAGLAVTGSSVCPPGPPLQRSAGAVCPLSYLLILWRTSCITSRKANNTIFWGKESSSLFQIVDVHILVPPCEAGAFGPIMVKGNKIKYVYFKWNYVAQTTSPILTVFTYLNCT